MTLEEAKRTLVPLAGAKMFPEGTKVWRRYHTHRSQSYALEPMVVMSPTYMGHRAVVPVGRSAQAPVVLPLDQLYTEDDTPALEWYRCKPSV